MNTILLLMNVIDIYSHCISLHFYNFHLVYYISISIRKYIHTHAMRARTRVRAYTHTRYIYVFDSI